MVRRGGKKGGGRAVGARKEGGGGRKWRKEMRGRKWRKGRSSGRRRIKSGPTLVCMVNLTVSNSLTASLILTESRPSFSSVKLTVLACSL